MCCVMVLQNKPIYQREDRKAKTAKEMWNHTLFITYFILPFTEVFKGVIWPT